MTQAIGRTRRTLAGIAIMVSTSLALSLAQASTASATVGLRNQVLKATNSSRVDHDKHRVSLNARMSKKARAHSVAMAEAGTLFHTSDVSDYLRGVSWSRWGENVGMTSEDVPALQAAFMDSKVHKTNILKGSFSHVAVGAIRRDGVLWVTVFFYG